MLFSIFTVEVAADGLDEDGVENVDVRMTAADLVFAPGRCPFGVGRRQRHVALAAIVDVAQFAVVFQPEGFREKGLMVTDYLSRSMTFFRDARAQCEEAFVYAKAQHWVKIALVGPGDLADIAQLVAQGLGFSLQVIDKTVTDFSHLMQC